MYRRQGVDAILKYPWELSSMRRIKEASVYDIVIKKARVVSPDATVLADVAVRGERVAAILEPESDAPAHHSINADGKYLLPGLIDPHTHIEHGYTPETSTQDDFFTGTVSGALGGVTTIIDFAIQPRGTSPMEIIEKRLSQAEKSAGDYAFHACFTEATDDVLDQIGDIVKAGIPSFKIFMAYRSRGRQCDDGAVLAILEEAKKHNALVGAHTENGDIIDYYIARALRRGQRSAIYHALTRPPFTEEECMLRAFFLAKEAGAPFYDFHMSIERGVEILRNERAAGRPIYGETCTQYLALTKEVLRRDDGNNFICSPPMRDQDDIEALWSGLSEGVVSTTASDNCTFSTVQKKLGQDCFDEVPNGIWGLGFRLPIMFSEGVQKGRLSVNRLAAVTSTNAARIFGMFPRKGIIAPGSDADMVLLDPDQEKTLSVKDSFLSVDWCPYEEMRVRGAPILTMLRGKIIVEEGRFIGEQGDGQFIKREIGPDILQHPIV
jgi:dihydropyrimidinase